MMDPMATTQITFFQLYWLLFVCTISLVVSSVVATKKMTKNAIKKAKDLKHYSANPNDSFSSDINSLSFTIKGEPVSLNRIASGKWGRYDSQKSKKKSFNTLVVRELPVIHDTPLCKLGTAEVKVDVTYTFAKGVIHNDIDNLVKYLLDCLETIKVFDNDVQVMFLRVLTRQGHRNMVAIKITQKAAMDNDEVIVMD